MNRNQVDNLPPAARREVLRQIAEQDRRESTIHALKDGLKAAKKKPRIQAPPQSHGGIILSFKSDLERDYHGHLKACLLGGEILGFAFEAVRLKLADGCTYTPDFLIITIDGLPMLHEVKGYWREDAKIKYKVAADMYADRFEFRVVTREGGTWRLEARP